MGKKVQVMRDVKVGRLTLLYHSLFWVDFGSSLNFPYV